MIDPDQMSKNIYNPNSKILQLSVPAQIGDIIRYTFRDITTKTIVPNTWSDYQVFESEMPLLKATYQIDAPRSLPLKNILIKDEIEGTIKADRIERGERIIYTWQICDVPQYFPEPSMPDAYTQTQRLLVSTLESWEAVAVVLGTLSTAYGMHHP